MVQASRAEVSGLREVRGLGKTQDFGPFFVCDKNFDRFSTGSGHLVFSVLGPSQPSFSIPKQKTPDNWQLRQLSKCPRQADLLACSTLFGCVPLQSMS